LVAASPVGSKVSDKQPISVGHTDDETKKEINEGNHGLPYATIRNPGSSAIQSGNERECILGNS
jgi:hypothetical protein